MQHVPNVIIQLGFVFLAPAIKRDTVGQDCKVRVAQNGGYAVTPRVGTLWSQCRFARGQVLLLLICDNAGRHIEIGARIVHLADVTGTAREIIGWLPI